MRIAYDRAGNAAIYADDTAAIALFNAISADPAGIFAPE
jgi:hypothetical protein